MGLTDGEGETSNATVERARELTEGGMKDEAKRPADKAGPGPEQGIYVHTIDRI